jgi:hypothetical protein
MFLCLYLFWLVGAPPFKTARPGELAYLRYAASNADFVRSGIASYRNGHEAFPFLLCFYFRCGSEFSAPGTRIRNYFLRPCHNRLMRQQLYRGVVAITAVFGKDLLDDAVF